MASLNDVLDALKEADRQGATEDATRLAQIANRMRTAQQPESSQEGSFMAKGFARSLGAPADLLQSALGTREQIGGSKSIERGLEAIGIGIPEREAETPSEYARAGVGEVLAMFGPGMGLVKLLTRGTGIASTISKQIINTAIKHPTATVAAEVGGGAGMGLGRQVGEEHPELAPYAEVFGGIAGSMGPGAVSFLPSTVATRTARKVAQKASLPFSEAGARYRAGEFVKKQVADPEITARTAREESISGLPPAVMTGEERLMVLYNKIKALDPVQNESSIKQLSRSAFKLEQEMKAMGYEAPEVMRDILETRIASIERAMDSRILKRVEAAQKRLEKIPVARRQSAESLIVRDELTKVMEEERKLVQDAWSKVPKKTVVRVENTKSAVADILEELPSAQSVDVPLVLRKHMVLKDEVASLTVNEMQGLRSRLLEISRQARSQSKWNKARICNDVSDAILQDMTVSAPNVVTPEGKALSIALASTKKFKERFERGVVGKILGYEKTSAPSISPELTLDIATRGKGIVDIDKVAITPAAKAATERYLSRSFTDYALDPKGSISPSKAEKWIRNNDEILDSFPNLRGQLGDASKAQELATQTKTIMDARKARLRNPKVSVAARYLNANIGDEIKGILKSPDPVRNSKVLVRMAQKDTTGEALGGLRSGFVEHVFERASLGGYNSLGEKTLSGNAILGFINENRNVMRQVFSQEQISRLTKVGKELSKLEMLEKAKGVPIELNDAASNLLKFASRFGGAAVGRKWGQAVGAGGTVQIPGFFAEQWHKVASYLTKNRFERLVNDAVMSPDGKLLEALLMPIDKPLGGGAKAREVTKRVNAWLAASGNNVLRDIKDEEGGVKTEQ